MAYNVARRAYSAEQLLALRRSASDEPALEMENKAEEGEIKDQVLRNTRSFAARSSSRLISSDTLQPPTDFRVHSGPVLSEIDPNNQTLRPLPRHRSSPTPSLKKKKAEQILKEHGSPPGLRVTAGGRIVPGDQSPLCSPRYGYSAISKNGGLIRFAPGYPPQANSFPNFAKSLPNGFVAQDPSGRLCQMVDGQFLPIDEVNGIPKLYIAAPNLNDIPLGRPESAESDGFNKSNARHDHQPKSSSTAQLVHGPTVTAQVQALEREYTKLEQERRELDKAEVLQRSAMTGKAYTQLIEKRRELVSRLNDIRVSIKSLNETKAATTASSPRAVGRTSPMMAQMPQYMGQHAPSHPMYGWPSEGNTFEQPPMMPFYAPPIFPEMDKYMPAHHFAGHMQPLPLAQPFHGQAPFMLNGFQQYGQPTENAVAPQNPPIEQMPATKRALGAWTSRYSATIDSEEPLAVIHHPQPLAVQKRESTTQGSKSALNPMSPSYLPGGSTTHASTPPLKATSNREDSADPPLPALAEAVRAHNAWIGGTANISNSASSNENAGHLQHSSGSSYATADFFPQNPRDHSMNKQAYPEKRNVTVHCIENVAIAPYPSSDGARLTPEKEMHISDWNPTIPDHAFGTASRNGSAEEDAIAALLHETSLVETDAMHDPIPDRAELNVSPKTRRPEVQDRQQSISEVDRAASLEHSRPDHESAQHVAVPTVSSQAARIADDYTEGLAAGLARAPIGPEKGGQFLDGYCAGLLRSTHVQGVQPIHVNAEQQRNIAHPTTAKSRSRSSSRSRQLERRSAVASGPPTELHLNSLDNLKQAVFAPSNENALLSPGPTAPLVTEIPPLHVAHEVSSWANAEAPIGTDAVLTQLRNGNGTDVSIYPERTSSRQLPVGLASFNTHKEPDDLPRGGKSSSGFATCAEEKAVPPPDRFRRAVSSASQSTTAMQSSYLHRAYPGHRVLSSPALDWKSATSIAQVAGMATGYFAQFDGTLHELANLPDGTKASTASSGTPSTTSRGLAIDTSTPQRQFAQSPKFREGTMPTDESPTPVSPTSPNSSPGKKNVSPAKAKFAQIAGKAGIKVRADRPASKDESILEPEQMSPQEKRRWRDVWKKRTAE